MHNLAQDPLLWTRDDLHLDLKVGDLVKVGERRGRVTKVTGDVIYPVAVLLDGETREMRPIFHSIKQLGER